MTLNATTGRRLTSAERAGIRYLEQSPQYGRFLHRYEFEGTVVYGFSYRTVYWPVVRQAARDSREAVNMWRCVTCDRLQPYFLKRCKACKPREQRYLFSTFGDPESLRRLKQADQETS